MVLTSVEDLEQETFKQPFFAFELPSVRSTERSFYQAFDMPTASTSDTSHVRGLLIHLAPVHQAVFTSPLAKPVVTSACLDRESHEGKLAHCTSLHVVRICTLLCKVGKSRTHALLCILYTLFFLSTILRL